MVFLLVSFYFRWKEKWSYLKLIKWDCLQTIKLPNI